MKKCFIVLALALFAFCACMKAQVKIPVTLKDGTQTEITANMERPPFVSASIAYNANTGDVIIGADTSVEFNKTLQQVGAIAALMGTIYGTPATPAVGPLLK